MTMDNMTVLNQCDHLAYANMHFPGGTDIGLCVDCNAPKVFYYTSCPRCRGDIVEYADRVECADCDYEEPYPDTESDDALDSFYEAQVDHLRRRIIKPDSWGSHAAAEGIEGGFFCWTDVEESAEAGDESEEVDTCA